MISNSEYMLVSVGFGIAATCTICIPVIFFLYVRQISLSVDEDWRDEAPVFVRLVRRICDLLSNNNAIGLVKRAVSVKERQRIEKQLGEAGYAYSILAEEFVLSKWAASLTGFLVVISLLGPAGINMQTVVIGALFAAMLGFVYPDMKVRALIRARKRLLEMEFPFFLDVLVLTMRAGLALSTALEHAVNITRKGPIKQEMGRALSDIRCGVNRIDALQRVASRVCLPSLSNFVAAVCQAEETGGSLTVSLGEQARQRRRERFQKAEKLAGHAPVKLLVPLFLFIFPILFIIIGVPIALDLSESGLMG